MLIAAASACRESVGLGPGDEELQLEGAYPGSDEEVWTYMARYEEEARIRGIDLSLLADSVQVRILEIRQANVAGECQFDPSAANRVRLDRTTWDRVNDNLREFIVFHELGHCERLRRHKEDADEEGDCISIMASGTGSCRDRYNQQTRGAYLDELFDPERYGDLYE